LSIFILRLHGIVVCYENNSVRLVHLEKAEILLRGNRELEEISQCGFGGSTTRIGNEEM